MFYHQVVTLEVNGVEDDWYFEALSSAGLYYFKNLSTDRPWYCLWEELKAVLRESGSGTGDNGSGSGGTGSGTGGTGDTGDTGSEGISIDTNIEIEVGL
jgi:hypothetical protein